MYIRFSISIRYTLKERYKFEIAQKRQSLKNWETIVTKALKVEERDTRDFSACGIGGGG